VRHLCSRALRETRAGTKASAVMQPDELVHAPSPRRSGTIVWAGVRAWSVGSLPWRVRAGLEPASLQLQERAAISGRNHVAPSTQNSANLRQGAAKSSARPEPSASLHTKQGSKIHGAPYRSEFENGWTVAVRKTPCAGSRSARMVLFESNHSPKRQRALSSCESRTTYSRLGLNPTSSNRSA
jgi:hypothetical protein